MTIAEVVGAASAEAIGLSADACLKCNVCNTVCPVARVTDLFPGPKYVGPQAQRFRLGALLSPGTGEDSVVESPDKTVDYCSGCGANYYEPHVAAAALEVLERNGYEVIVPPQVCCGLPLISNGLYGAARGRARRNLEVLARYARAGYRIVGTSTSCTHTLKSEYREMLDLDDADARAVADATWDI